MKTLNLIFKTFIFLLAMLTSQLLFAQYTFRCMEFTTPEIGIVAGDNGIIIRTDDGGLTWSAIGSNTIQNLWKTSTGDAANILIAGTGGTILRSTDAGSTWQTMQSNTSTDLFSVSSRQDGLGFTVGRNGSIFRTTDHGSNWNVVAENHGNDLRGIAMDGDNGVIVGDKNNILFTTNAGQSWNQPNTALPFEFSFRFVRIIDRTTVFATTTTGQIVKSIDGGNSWNVVYSSSVPAALYRVNLVGGNLVSVGDNGKILVSQDLGDNWQEVASGITTNLYCLNFADDLTGYSAGANGVMLKTVDGGFTWQNMVYTLHKLEHRSSVINGNSIANDFKLEQNYPNPFNPETKINFYSPVNGNTSLKVFDVTGKEIATLLNGYESAGSHSVTFSANNFSAGIYFYTLNVSSEQGSFSKTNKMILVK